MLSHTILSAAALSLIPSTTSAGDPSCEGNIVDVAIANGFSTLVAAVETAGLVGALESAGPLTVFAPTNEAFADLPPVVLNLLLANPQILAEVLLHHVVAGEVPASIATGLNTAISLNGQRLDFTFEDGDLFIVESLAVLTDVGACNGVVHVIDKILVPNLSQAPGLRRAVAQLDVVDALIFVNFATGDFSALVGAVVEAGLVDDLKSLGSVTLFAPNDAAFAALPQSVLDAIELDPALLVDVLLYHAVPDTLFAADVLSQAGATTLLGEDLAFSTDGVGVFINDSQVIGANRAVANGVIHVVDSVLLP